MFPHFLGIERDVNIVAGIAVGALERFVSCGARRNYFASELLASCCKRVRAVGTDMGDILTASVARLALQFHAPRGTGTEESRNSSRDGRRSCSGGLD